MPITIRIPSFGGIKGKEHHGESPETYYVHTAGLKVVVAVDAARRVPAASPGDRGPRSGGRARAEGPLLGQGGGRAHRRRPGDRRGPRSCARAMPSRSSPTARWWRGASRPPTSLAAEGVVGPGDRPALALPARRRPCSPAACARPDGSWSSTRRRAPSAWAPRSPPASWSWRSTSWKPPCERVTGWDVPYPPASLEQRYLPTVERIAGRRAEGGGVLMARASSSPCRTSARGSRRARSSSGSSRPATTVALNQPIVEVETAKATVEIPSPFAGSWSSAAWRGGGRARRAPLGDVRRPTGWSGGRRLRRPNAAQTPTRAARPRPAAVAPGCAPAAAREGSGVRRSAGRKLAREPGVELAVDGRSRVEGRRHGRGRAGGGGATVGAIRRGRDRAADLRATAAIPHVTTFRTVDCTALESLRARAGGVAAPGRERGRRGARSGASGPAFELAGPATIQAARARDTSGSRPTPRAG